MWVQKLSHNSDSHYPINFLQIFVSQIRHRLHQTFEVPLFLFIGQQYD